METEKDREKQKEIRNYLHPLHWSDVWARSHRHLALITLTYGRTRIAILPSLSPFIPLFHRVSAIMCDVHLENPCHRKTYIKSFLFCFGRWTFASAKYPWPLNRNSFIIGFCSVILEVGEVNTTSWNYICVEQYCSSVNRSSEKVTSHTQANTPIKTCTHAHTHTHTCTHTHAHTHTRTQAHTHTYTHTNTPTHTHTV